MVDDVISNDILGAEGWMISY